MPPLVPFIRNEFNQTVYRDKSLIKIFATYGGYVPDPGNPQALPSLSGLTLVGGVSKIKMLGSERAGSSEVRILDYDMVDTIQEILPGLSSPKLELEYIVSYQQTFLEAIGFGGLAVKLVTRPMLFMFVLPSPNPNTVPYKTVVTAGVQVMGNPLDFSVEEKQDLRIQQDITLVPASILQI